MRTERLTRISIGALLFLILYLSLFTVTDAYAGVKGNPPVSYWKFDEGGGPTAYDSSGNGNHGTLYNHTKFVPGKIGKALQFDGTDDYVDCGNGASLNITTAITIEAWVKWPSASVKEIVVKMNNANTLPGAYEFYQSSNTVTFRTIKSGTNHDLTSAGSISPNTWTHIAATWDGTTKKIFINGVQDSNTQGETSPIDSTTGKLVIGAYANATYPFSGFIDDVRIYNYARASDQIMVDYNAGSAAHLGAGTDPNEGNAPVGYWPLDENTGTTAYDRSGNGNNGTTNASWVSGQYGSALSFNGSTSVNLGSGTTLDSASFTISMWLKPTSYDSTWPNDANSNVITARENYTVSGFRCGVTDRGIVKFWATQSGGTLALGANSAIGQNRFNYVTITYDSATTTGKMYIDGVQVASASGSYVVPTGINLGICSGTGGVHWFNGIIDDVKFYNYARTSAQVAYDYNKGKPVAQYKFDEGTGTIAHNEYSTADTGAAPVGWWRMDNNWNDSSGNGNTGTANGDATFSSSAKIGPYCGTFDGTGDYIDCGNGTSLQVSTDSGATWEAWIKTSVTAQQTVIQQNFNPRICLSNNRIDWYDSNLGSSVFSDTVTTSDSNWHHIAVTVNSHNLSFYIDGVRRGTATSGSAAASNLRIGQTAGSAAAFSGLIDDVRIYNYSRTSEQIYNDYKTTQGTLVGDTKFVDGKIGKALQFDGNGDYLNVADNASLQVESGNFTVSVWVKPSTVQQQAILFKGNPNMSNGYILVMNRFGNDISLTKGGISDQAVSYTFQTNTWYHIVAVQPLGGNVTYYINGMSIGSYSNTQGYSSSSGQNLYIGDADTFFANKFTGLIDDVRIYNYARSADQVMQDYNAGASRLGAQSAGEKDPWGGAMPIAWWKLDENTGVLAQDASGNGNNGTLVNSPTWTQGKNGPCLNFNGSSGQVNIGTPAILNQDFTALTLEAWIYANSSPIGSDSAVAGKFTVYGFTLHTGTPNLYFYINNGGNGLAPNYSSYLNAWHHIAGTFDGTTQKIYIDGKFVASKASSATSTGTGGSFGIGGDGAGSTIFNGKIDDVKFYNYCRTQAQIAWDYNKGKPIAYWKLEENTGTIAYDSSGNGNNSIVWTGAPTWAQGKYGYGLSFDNEGEAVAARVENLPAGSSPRTISCWFKPTSFDDIVLGSICGYPYNAYGGGVNQWFEIKYSDAGDKKFGFHLYNTHYLTTNIFEPNNWYHLDAVYDGTNVKLYVNGKLEIDQAVALNTSVNPTGANFNIYGEINQPTDYKRPGFIDDVRVYNYARTADQVMQDYNAGAAARLGD